MGLFLGFVLSLFILIKLRDALNRFIYQYLFLLIRNEKVSTLVFALIFFPGVVVHEISHWLMAKLVFVKTHRLSLFPEWVEGGTIRFGYVEMSKTDKIRGALIGLAPLFAGIMIILWIAFYPLNLEPIVVGSTQNDMDTIVLGIKTYFSTKDVLLWSYLLLVVSNTMLPSTSDRKAWLPAVLVFVTTYIFVILVELGSPTSQWLVDVATVFAKTLTKAFSVAAVLNLILLLPLWLLDFGVKRVRR